MKKFRAFVLLTLLAALGAGAGRAGNAGDDEAREALRKVQAAQDDAPACRMTMRSTNLLSGKLAVMTTEFAKPDSIHSRLESNGKVTMEMFTDGKRTFMRQGAESELQEAPAHVSGLLVNSRKEHSLATLMNTARDVRLTGHESVDGQAASVYEFTADVRQGMVTHSKVWASEADGRPLKAEADVQGSSTNPADPGQKTNIHTVTTFVYDPSIKIVLPGG